MDCDSSGKAADSFLGESLSCFYRNFYRHGAFPGNGMGFKNEGASYAYACAEEEISRKFEIYDVRSNSVVVKNDFRRKNNIPLILDRIAACQVCSSSGHYLILKG